MSENFKSLVLQDKCNIEIFLSPVYFVYASSEGSGKSAYMYRQLDRISAACRCNKYRNLQCWPIFIQCDDMSKTHLFPKFACANSESCGETV